MRRFIVHLLLSVFVAVCSFVDVLVGHLVALSSSPILAVRQLSSRAVVKLIPQCSVTSCINNSISSLPSSNASLVQYNQLHGQLLQIHCLLNYLLSTTVERYMTQLGILALHCAIQIVLR